MKSSYTKNVSTPGSVLSKPENTKPEYSTVVLSSVNMKNVSILTKRRENVIILSLDKLTLHKKEIVEIHSKIDVEHSDDYPNEVAVQHWIQ